MIFKTMEWMKVMLGTFLVFQVYFLQLHSVPVNSIYLNIFSQFSFTGAIHMITMSFLQTYQYLGIICTISTGLGTIAQTTGLFQVCLQ